MRINKFNYLEAPASMNKSKTYYIKIDMIVSINNHIDIENRLLVKTIDGGSFELFGSAEEFFQLLEER